MNNIWNSVEQLNYKIKGHEQLIVYYENLGSRLFSNEIQHHKNLIKYLKKRKLIITRGV